MSVSSPYPSASGAASGPGSPRPFGPPPSWALVPVLLLFLGLAACSDSGPTGPTPEDVVAVEIEGDTSPLRVGQTRTFTAQVFLSSQETTDELEVTWSSGSPGTLEVSGDGTATALAQGPATIRAEVGERSAQLSFTILSEEAPEVDGVDPEAFADGETAVLTGRNFGEALQDNEVRLDGLPLEVVSASASQLEVLVPEGICLPSGPVEGTVTVAGETASFTHTYQGPEPDDLPHGELVVERGEDTLCVRLPAASSGSSYLMGVQSTSLVDEEVISARLEVGVPAGTGAAHGGPVGKQAANWADGHVHSDAGPLRPIGPGARRGSGYAKDDPHAIHTRMLQALNAEAEALRGRLGPATSDVMADMPARSEVPESTSEGDTVTVRFPEIDDNLTVNCTDFEDIHAVVRVRSDHFFVLEDLENPSGGYTEEDFRDAAAFLESTTRPRLEEHFGSFTDLDDNGRVVLVFTQEVNRLGPLGFVNPLDFFTSDECPASNGGEFLFNQVPDPQGSVGRQVSRSEAVKGLNSLNAHELTHVIQSGRRFTDVPNSMEIWAAEGQAVLGEEIVGWEELGLGAAQNLPAEVAFFGTDPEDPDTEWFFNRFVDLAFWYGFEGPQEPQVEGAPEACGWLGRDTSGPCDYPRLPYGVSWSFIRWVTDQYGPERAGGREGVHRDWIDSDRASMTDLAGIVGEDYRDLLAGWAVSLWADERPGMDARLLFPSWNLRSVETGLVDPATLQPATASFQSGVRNLSVGSASTSYTLVSGSSRPETVFRVRGTGGGPAPSSLQLWVVKVP
ncbi:MAG: hypothetical protein EA352_02960 [Gemmatimonadales bacterium]|nr:MAG: hypothetical protein EA352_02960 [Gemmatimonadales bacterium]